jgi:hypothetical protein
LIVWTGACALAVTVFGNAAWARGEAKGTLSYKAKSGAGVVTVKHAHLFKGPDMVSGKVIRRLVLSAADVSGALKACQSMSCSDGGIGEGLTVDFDAGPRLNYWFVANDQLVQHSGTADPASVTLTADTPARMAGTIDIDGRASGGPVIKVEFDATVIKEVKK